MPLASLPQPVARSGAPGAASETARFVAVRPESSYKGFGRIRVADGAWIRVLRVPRALAGGFLRGDADGLQVLRDAVRKNPRAGHEDVRPRFRDNRRRVHLDPAVDLELCLEPLSVDVRPGVADLRHD